MAVPLRNCLFSERKDKLVFIKENIDETIFMFALFKRGKSDKEEIENKKKSHLFQQSHCVKAPVMSVFGSKIIKKLGAIVTEIDISTEAYSTIQSLFLKKQM